MGRRKVEEEVRKSECRLRKFLKSGKFEAFDKKKRECNNVAVKQDGSDIAHE